MYELDALIENVENSLLNSLNIESVNPKDPIIVNYVPKPWIVIGVGNYAAALVHQDFQEFVVKVYAPGRPGIEGEIISYSRIKDHPAFSKCYHHGKNYLILKRLYGNTLFSCINKGIQIPEQVINDIDDALRFARSVGLHPHDVHAKNVMMIKGRGVVVDISDFNKVEPCSLWSDFKKAYYKIYIPFLYKHHPPIPKIILNVIRKIYRLLKKLL